MGKQLEIFRPGKHIAMGGQQLTFSEEDVRATVAAYDPALHEAPLVVGHPGADAPAYGWVKSLAFAEGMMVADPDQVDPAFAELVNAGRYKKISGSFYTPDAPQNPVPGVYYLRHVGFLGAQPPAVKGLKSASFAESEEGVVEFGEWMDQVEAGLFRKLREWIIGKFGLEEADRALPEFDVDMVQQEAAQPEIKVEESPVFGETHRKDEEEASMPTHEELAAREVAIAEKEASFAEREAHLSRQEQAARHQGNLDFAEGLVREGKLLPALKEQAVALLDVAEAMGAHAVEFGEGESRQALSVPDALKGFLAAQPKFVEFGEFATHDKDAGAPADRDAEQIAALAVSFQEEERQAGRIITMTDAVKHVQGGK